MKKYLLTLVFVLITALAFAAPEPYAHVFNFNGINKNFLTNMINKQEATYSICVPNNFVNKDITVNTAEKIFLKSVNNWLYTTEKYIKDLKRKKEFEDILDLTEGKINFKRMPCIYFDTKEGKTNADITIVFENETKQCSNKVDGACYKDFLSVMFIGNRYSYNNFLRTITHELGHAFGLADQASGTTYTGSYVYNSKVKRPSIMELSERLTCDDVDGFITVIDRIKPKNRSFDSFCKDGLKIVNGKAEVKAGETFAFNETYKYFNADITVTYNEESNNSDTYLLDINITDFDTTKLNIAFLRNMGFLIPNDNVEILKHIQAKTHGSIWEKTDLKIEEYPAFLPKNPIGLWSLQLFIDGGETQIITKEFAIDTNNPATRIILNSNETDILEENLLLPTINYYPPRKGAVILNTKEDNKKLKQIKRKIKKFAETFSKDMSREFLPY